MLLVFVAEMINYEIFNSNRKIHSIFGADLSFANLDLEFNELVELKLCVGMDLSAQIKKLILLNEKSKYDNVIIILCRIQASTPQSADVERSIKANNLFKTSFRNRLNLETENK